jgi:hypothetical protein
MLQKYFFIFSLIEISGKLQNAASGEAADHIRMNNPGEVRERRDR